MLKAALLKMKTAFTRDALEHGREYQRQDRVLSVRLSDGLIKARVKGSANQIYNVHFDLKTWPDQPAECNCSVQKNFKHAAASLYAFQDRNSAPEKESEIVRSYLHEELLEADELEWYSESTPSGNEFFSYQLGIMIEGHVVSIVPLVADLLHRWDEETLESLPDGLILKLPIQPGKVLKISLGRIRPLLRLLLQYGHYRTSLNSEEYLKLKNYQLLLMMEAEQALASATARWHGTSELKAKLQDLINVSSRPEVSAPEGLQLSLRDYQYQGLNWLHGLCRSHLGGILADDMGLGKTVQTLAHILHEKEQGRLVAPSLVIAPTSLVNNWFDEAQRFTPSLKVSIYHGSARHRDRMEDYDLIISTYGLVQRDKQRFLKHTFYYLILDEAQFIKNARTKTTQMIYQLQATHRLCLTGTPLENHLGELWSLFHFLMPGFLGSSKQFRKFFRTPIEKQTDSEKQALLAQRIKPFVLRRSKSEVAKELPLKTEVTHRIELTGVQRDLYEAIRMSMEKKVREAISQQGLGKSQVVILDALLRLRQVCCDPRLLSIPGASMAYGHSAKLDVLMELLENVLAEGRRVLVFSQFTSMLKLIEERLTLKHYTYLKLTGQTKNRHALVKSFQQGSASIFLISLKAGGTGLNLTRADTVIHYDPWWNPAVENQASDRTHRIGQENPVFVYKLITSGTVEEVIQTLQEKKKRMIQGVLSETMDGGNGFSEENLKALFTPLG